MTTATSKTCNCLTWDQVSSAWDRADWLWPNCIIPVCANRTWSQTNISWINSNWKWSDCIKNTCVWSQLNAKWGAVLWTWDDCGIIQKCIEEIIKKPVVEYGGTRNPESPIEPWEPWDPYAEEKKKKLIRLYCRVKGIDPKTTEKLVKENIQIRVKDVKLIIESAKDIKIQILNFK